MGANRILQLMVSLSSLLLVTTYTGQHNQMLDLRGNPWIESTEKSRNSLLRGHLLAHLRGGAKTKPTKPRSWKEQSVHHRRIRQRSIKKNRGKNSQKAYLNPAALRALQKADDKSRLKQLEKKDAERRQKKANLVDTVEHNVRVRSMKVKEEADRKREEKYQTLEDYSDSIERELEELRQKRDENRGLVLPDWREEHPTFWKEVDEMNEGETDLDDPEKVWNAYITTGNTWKVAAYNRMMMNQQTSEKQLVIGQQALTTQGDGSGGGMILAAQSAQDTGPMVFHEISSEDVREAEAEERRLEEAEAKQLEEAKALKAKRKKEKKEMAIEMPEASQKKLTYA
ncbi:hypothetical protein GUITHDRAFT_131901 [Guillardia theta CCMP2712]|uniref:Uncharacterized protein n=1 Tax=Guillardia theta (strain CCMP2712) TaxID=905079 RepID=L1K2U5_GUITC|nr:hypothetical protein GUITHDRAFT_131901 [Guillardia theta CCMP2712]EKX54924.1 hypothetical protein GUITHDRAFT_131901 [Guillardia theta CCMP2712]|eukprot:XP_005841904.1 hypothetical protein GUITHDRAFT_131901 [Guillardia theta CCMP2712]